MRQATWWRRVVGDEDPGKIRVDAKQDGNAIQVERKQDESERMQSKERRKAKQHPEGVGGRRSLGRIVRVQQLLEPGASSKPHHRHVASKWVKPSGSGSTALPCQDDVTGGSTRRSV